jgi:hypothetical protein
MSKSNTRSVRNCPLRPIILLAVLTPISLSWGSHGGTSAGSDPGIGLDLKAHAEGAAFKAASNAATMGFAPSLEMKENADFLLTPGVLVQAALADRKAGEVYFDAAIELSAPLCRTYVVLFARYWASRDCYRVAVVWAEPHAGSLNFPVYPPTLNVMSDPNSFGISHQLIHTYDGLFAKPLGARGPFRHKFNSYPLSEIRFGEREAQDLRSRMNATRLPPDANGQAGALHSRRQTILLPERPITVAFSGEGPTITIGGQKRQFKELAIMDCAGGRKFILDYRPIEVRGRAVSLPSRIEVYTGDGKQLLRSARLFNFTSCEATVEQAGKAAGQFSLFDPNEVRCRDLLLKYWLKRRSEIPKDDIETLERLREDFAAESSTRMTIGEQLKRMNMLLQVGWMLDDPNSLAEDFREYTRLLRSNGLGRMILYGGENLLETTSRWGQPDTADKLLPIWLDACVAENDMATILDFASARLTQGKFWTTAKLLAKALERLTVSPGQRFAAEALRCTALSRIAEMVRNPDDIRSEVDIAQARWVLWGTTEQGLHGELKASLAAAQRSYAVTDRPTRQDQALKRKLDAIEQNLLGG